MSPQKLDIILQNFNIIDGTGKKSFKGCIGIRDGKIASVTRKKSIQKNSEKIFHPSDFSEENNFVVVSPGFVDMHSHSDLAFFMENDKNNMATIGKLSQGITTEIVGQDGFSAAPIYEEKKEEYARHWASFAGYLNPDKWIWNGVSDYLEMVNKESPTRVETLVGHSTLRINVMGYENREPTEKELEKMKGLLKTSLQEGALGLSLGLIYPPGMFAKKDELLELMRVVARENGLIMAHIRNESEKLLEAVNEYLKLTNKAGVRAHISHLKVCGENKNKKYHQLIESLRGKSEENRKITFDIYPYNAGSTTLQAILPPWVREGNPNQVMKRLKEEETVQKMAEDIFIKENSSWENYIQFSEGGLNGIIISDAPDTHKELVGKSLAEIGEEAGYNPKTKEGKINTFHKICKLLVKTELELSMISFNQSMEIIRKLMELDKLTIGTDGVLGKNPHPRLFGAMTRYLRLMRESSQKTFEQSIHQITEHPSKIVRRFNIGTIEEGVKADLVIVDIKKVEELNSYENPTVPSKGIFQTIVNGEMKNSNGYP